MNNFSTELDSFSLLILISEFDIKDKSINNLILSFLPQLFYNNDEIISLYLNTYYKLSSDNIFLIINENLENNISIKTLLNICKIILIDSKLKKNNHLENVKNIFLNLINLFFNICSIESLNPWNFEIRNNFLEMFFNFEIFFSHYIPIFNIEIQELLYFWIKKEFNIRYNDLQIMNSLIKMSMIFLKSNISHSIINLIGPSLNFIYSIEFDPCTSKGLQISRSFFEFFISIKSISNEIENILINSLIETFNLINNNSEKLIELLLNASKNYNNQMKLDKRLKIEIELPLRQFFQLLIKSKLNFFK